MKHLLIYITVITLLISSCSESSSKKIEIKNNPAPYFLPTPEKWTTEEFPVPPGFAAELPYKGTEEIRFAPGWSKPDSQDYWTYLFLWVIDNATSITTDELNNYLEVYYTGLAAINSKNKESLKKDSFKTKSNMTLANTEENDQQTYQGNIQIMDYMRAEPLTLNCKVHIVKCNKSNSLFIFHELSPKPITDTVWGDLSKIRKGFTCN